jgi:hypothetical protein
VSLYMETLIGDDGVSSVRSVLYVDPGYPSAWLGRGASSVDKF